MFGSTSELVGAFLQKALGVLVSSRCPVATDPRAARPHRDDTHGTGGEFLLIEEPRAVRSAPRVPAVCLPQPRDGKTNPDVTGKLLVTQASSPSPLIVSVYRDDRPSGGPVTLLERWQFTIDATRATGPASAADRDELWKRAAVSLRALFVTARALPAHTFASECSGNGGGGSVNGVGVGNGNGDGDCNGNGGGNGGRNAAVLRYEVQAGQNAAPVASGDSLGGGAGDASSRFPPLDASTRPQGFGSVGHAERRVVSLATSVGQLKVSVWYRQHVGDLSSSPSTRALDIPSAASNAAAAPGVTPVSASPSSSSLTNALIEDYVPSDGRGQLQRRHTPDGGGTSTTPTATADTNANNGTKTTAASGSSSPSNGSPASGASKPGPGSAVNNVNGTDQPGSPAVHTPGLPPYGRTSARRSITAHAVRVNPRGGKVSNLSMTLMQSQQQNSQQTAGNSASNNNNNNNNNNTSGAGIASSSPSNAAPPSRANPHSQSQPPPSNHTHGEDASATGASGPGVAVSVARSATSPTAVAHLPGVLMSSRQRAASSETSNSDGSLGRSPHGLFRNETNSPRGSQPVSIKGARRPGGPAAGAAEGPHSYQSAQSASLSSGRSPAPFAVSPASGSIVGTLGKGGATPPGIVKATPPFANARALVGAVSGTPVCPFGVERTTGFVLGPQQQRPGGVPIGGGIVKASGGSSGELPPLPPTSSSGASTTAPAATGGTDGSGGSNKDKDKDGGARDADIAIFLSALESAPGTLARSPRSHHTRDASDATVESMAAGSALQNESATAGNAGDGSGVSDKNNNGDNRAIANPAAADANTTGDAGESTAAGAHTEEEDGVHDNFDNADSLASKLARFRAFRSEHIDRGAGTGGAS